MKKERGHLRPLKNLFQKYQERLIAPEASVVDCFVDVVGDVIGVTVDKKKVKYNPNTKTITILGVSPIKTEVKLHQEEILNHMKGRLGVKNSPNTVL